ncbi:MAG TPA: GNAT family N-acetyltransferase [Stellaceae bacterium]|nr:GNAT family N-acetyltransferase [Stellaceae bacterium]
MRPRAGTGLPCRIRPLGPFDVDAAAVIHGESFGMEAWNRKAIQEVLAMPTAIGRLAVDPVAGDLRPLGMMLISIVAGEAELLTIAVRQAARRRGVGAALVDDFLALATARGATEAFLEVAEDNDPAFRLYSAHGFTAEGWRHDYYRRPGNRRVAARVLRRAIP